MLVFLFKIAIQLVGVVTKDVGRTIERQFVPLFLGQVVLDACSSVEQRIVVIRSGERNTGFEVHASAVHVVPPNLRDERSIDAVFRQQRQDRRRFDAVFLDEQRKIVDGALERSAVALRPEAAEVHLGNVDANFRQTLPKVDILDVPPFMPDVPVPILVQNLLLLAMA